MKRHAYVLCLGLSLKGASCKTGALCPLTAPLTHFHTLDTNRRERARARSPAWRTCLLSRHAERHTATTTVARVHSPHNDSDRCTLATAHIHQNQLAPGHDRPLHSPTSHTLSWTSAIRKDRKVGFLFSTRCTVMISTFTRGRARRSTYFHAYAGVGLNRAHHTHKKR